MKGTVGGESVCVPAVDHHGAGIRRCGGFDPPQEGQQARGMVWHSVLRQRGEMKLAYLVFGRVAALERGKYKKGTFKIMASFNQMVYWH